MRYKNIPIPETILFPILFGVILHYFFPGQVFPPHLAWTILAIIFLPAGLAGVLWSTLEAGKSDLADPDTLITTGPYKISRNPMYLSWYMIHLSVFLFNRSIWLLGLFFLGFVITHYGVILREEKKLRQHFGDFFEDYCRQVRRYL